MRRTHCKRGHEMTEQNSRWRTLRGKYQMRGCRACVNACARLKYRGAVLGQGVPVTIAKWEFARLSAGNS